MYKSKNAPSESILTHYLPRLRKCQYLQKFCKLVEVCQPPFALFAIGVCNYGQTHGLRRPREEIAFTARPKIYSHSQIFKFSRSIFCLPHRHNFSDIFDLCLHWVSVVRAMSKSILHKFICLYIFYALWTTSNIKVTSKF